MRRKLLIQYHLTMSVLIFSQLVLFYIIFMTLYPFEVVTLNKQPLAIHPTVCSGGIQEIHLDFKKNMAIRPEVTWLLVDGYTVELPDSSRNKPVGDNFATTKKMIPENIEDGDYYIEINLSYNVFFLRRPIQYIWRTNSFYVERCE